MHSRSLSGPFCFLSKGVFRVQAKNPTVGSLYLPAPAAVRAARRGHHAVHLHLRHRRWPVRVQLCGQNGLCGGQPDHAAAPAAGHHRLHAGHRRQRHRGHHAGRGRPEKGRPLLYHVPAGRRHLRLGAGPAGACVAAAHCHPAGCQGRAAGLRRALRPHPDAVAAHLCAAEHVPELLCHRRKAAPRLLLHGGCRLAPTWCWMC